MELLELIKDFLFPALVAYVAYNEYNVSKLRSNVTDRITSKDLEVLVDLKLAIHSVEIREIKGDLHRIEGKLDKILDGLLNH